MVDLVLEILTLIQAFDLVLHRPVGLHDRLDLLSLGLIQVFGGLPQLKLSLVGQGLLGVPLGGQQLLAKVVRVTQKAIHLVLEGGSGRGLISQGLDQVFQRPVGLGGGDDLVLLFLGASLKRLVQRVLANKRLSVRR